jgi:hypothetical protein
MAKPARGLPEDFELNLPDEKPVHIGDFLDEEPPPIPVGRSSQKPLPQPVVEHFVPAAELHGGTMRERDERVGERAIPRPVPKSGRPGQCALSETYGAADRRDFAAPVSPGC